MEHILLVEPNYKNKYPPIGLMKISTYFKNKGDFVLFQKGLLPQNEVKSFDKVFITTLFTFDFDVCVETIKYYVAIVGVENVFVGGIASTIMPEKFKSSIPGLNILEGQLVSSNILGYSDDINIDILELDYDILWDIEYDYPSADSYFLYTSRGCPRKCQFCAVKTLEPHFYICTNIEEQILRVDEKYGQKKQLLIMDNNALYSNDFGETIDKIVALGFGTENNSIKKNNNMRFYLRSLRNRMTEKKQYINLINRIKKEFRELKLNRISTIDKEKLAFPIELINKGQDLEFIKYLFEEQEYITEFFDKYNYHSIKRYVDFNQGLDARLLTKEKAEQLSRLAIKPCRIAFDDLKNKDEYFRAIRLASEHGVQHFSNYLLYNFKDKPEELWERLFLNVSFCEDNKLIKSLFSFPMKYASIEHTDRSYIGEFWNKKYLKSINVILNVTSGIVAKEKDFFLRAYGATKEEYYQILAMPDDFIRYRDYFETNKLIDKWKQEYRQLSPESREELLQVLSNCETEINVKDMPHSNSIEQILTYYSVKKRDFEKNKLFYMRLFGLN